MKTYFTQALALLMGVLVIFSSSPLLLAQDAGEPTLSPDDLDQLVAPIALYPDPLVALILQAATVPTDVVLADRYLQDGSDPNAIDQQNWDDSVKGLARYPDVLTMMDQNLDWTNQLGAAVLAQQPDVMAAIQAQRAKANALGNLASTPQQQVIVQDQIIQIVPADPEVIYVPVYDPQVVYIDRSPGASLITFGIGLAIGAWLGGGFDWHDHRLYSHGYYRPGYGWRSNQDHISHNVWHPNNSRPRPRPTYNPQRPGSGHLPGFQRPPGGGNRPGQGGSGKPPGGRPPGSKPPGGHGPVQNTRPAPKPPIGLPGGKPAPQPNRPPAMAKSQGKPALMKKPEPARSQPAIKPLSGSTRPPFNHAASNTKRPSAAARPATSQPAKRPAPASHPAPKPVRQSPPKKAPPKMDESRKKPQK